MLEAEGVKFTPLPPLACALLWGVLLAAGAGIARAGDNGARELSCECVIAYGSVEISTEGEAASNEEWRETDETDVTEKCAIFSARVFSQRRSGLIRVTRVRLDARTPAAQGLTAS